MKPKRFSRNSSSGFTAIELLVSSFVGLIISAITLNLAQTSHFYLGKDLARTRLTQNLRGSLDILTSDIRISGENLSESFPSILLVDGTGTVADSLTLRRGLLSEALTLCSPIILGPSSVHSLVVGNITTTPGCDYTSNLFAANQFQTVRNSRTDTLRGFVLNTGTKQGQFFEYQGNTVTSNEIKVKHSPIVWNSNYPVSTSVIYLIDEQRYILEADTIKRYIDGNTTNPQTISFGIKSLSFSILNKSNENKLSFTSSDGWTKIKYIEVSIDGEESHANNTITRSLKGRLFPRNVLSH
jgi:hypothetical protein